MMEVILREAKAVIPRGEPKKSEWAQWVPEEGEEGPWVLEKEGKEGKGQRTWASLMIQGIRI